MIRGLLLLLFLASPAFAETWTFEHSPTMPMHPALHKNGWFFIFPRSGDGVDYLTTPSTSLTNALNITVTGKISGKARFLSADPFDTGKAPAAMRLFIQAQNDGCLCNDFGRWWSNPQSISLRSGPFRLTVPLRPANWSSVFGHKGDSSAAARQGFASALAHPAKIGMTFGAGNNFGHGVIAKGPASMIISSFQIRRVK